MFKMNQKQNKISLILLLLVSIALCASVYSSYSMNNQLHEFEQSDKKLQTNSLIEIDKILNESQNENLKLIESCEL